MTDLATNGNGNGARAPASILDALRERRRLAASDRYFDIEVPGYGGLLVLRLGPVTGSTFTKLRERMEASSSPERDFNLNADALIAATRDVLGRAHVADELRPLDDEEPHRLDDRLAASLGIEAANGRDLVRQLFDMANAPEVAVMRTAGEYMAWAGSASSEVDDAFAGESVPSPS